MCNQQQCFLIDNDEDDRELFALALAESASHVSCRTAASGAEALETLNNPQLIPDYIFIDVNMPRMNGLQCLRAIRELPWLQHTRVYMYSTSADPLAQKEALQLGATGFLVKPSSYGGLVALLASVIQPQTFVS